MPRALLLLLVISLFTVGLPTPAEANAGAYSAASTPHYQLASMEVSEGTVALLVKLQMAQFHHLRAMHGIGWSLVGTGR